MIANQGLSGEATGSFRYEFKSGWRPLLGALIGAGCGISSICFYTNGVFAVAIANDTGWSRGSVQIGVSIMILMAVITAPLAGWLIDRFGPRRVGLISLPLFGLGLAGLSVSDNSVQHFYFGWGLMSLIAAGTLPVTWTKVVISWFDNYRGLALGAALTGTGLAATFAPSYAVWLIDLFGWRHAYAVLSGTIMVISIPAVYLLFHMPTSDNSPLEKKLPVDVSKRHSDLCSPIKLSGLSVLEALSGYRFWMIALGILFAAGSISGMITSLAPLLTDNGSSLSSAARYAGLMGVSVIGGRLVAGFLMDYIWAPAISAFFLVMPALAALLLATSLDQPSMIIIAALLIGLAAGAEVDLMAFLASRYFGLKNYGVLYGGIYVFFSIGAGLAPALFGWSYDIFGSYNFVLYAAAGASVSGALLMLTLGRYPVFRPADT